jgi:hypothetical protein
VTMSPEDYDPDADFAANGSVLCDDCGTRVRPKTLATLPDHGCVTVQQLNRQLLALVAQRRVRRDALGNVWIVSGGNLPAEEAPRMTLARLTDAGLITVPDDGLLEPWYEITDRALQGA